MRKVRMVSEWNLRDFAPPILGNQTPKFLLCNGLLRLGKHHKFASAIVGVGAVGLVLAYKYGSLTSSLGSKWVNILMSARAADYIHYFPCEELTVPGLRNMGNNCFLNVILQALASSYFFQSFIDSCVQISEKPVEENADFMPLAAAVSILLEELSVLGAEGRVASPRQVMMALKSHAINFDLARQQDAAEALGHLLSALKEECLQYIQQYMPHHGSLSSVLALCDSEFTNHRGRGEQISLEVWNHYLKRPLDGTIGSILTCQSCSFQSSTHFEFFHDLPIAPIVGSDGDIMEGCTIDNCLKKFTAPEQIRNYRCSNCSHLAAIEALSLRFEVNKAIIQKIKDCSDDDSCSCETLVAKEGLPWPAAYRNACKQLRLGCCPKVLCIHLQRASINEIGELIKLRCGNPNNVCLGSKSMSSLFSDTDGNQPCRGSHSKMQYSPVSHLQTIEDQNGNNNTDGLDNARCIGSRRSLPYGLISVVQHNGNLGSGHYTVYRKVKVGKQLTEAPTLCMTSKTDYEEEATFMDEKENTNSKDSEFARTGNKNTGNSDVIWFRISDSHVERVTEKCVLGAYASMLFYERLEDADY